MHTALLALLAAAPPLALCTFFYIQDDREPEPRLRLATAFALGLLSVAPAMLCAQLLMHALPQLARSPLAAAFLFASLTEEAIKFGLLMLSIYSWEEFDEPYDGIVYTVALSLGFATTENALYVARGGAAVGALRALLTVPGHALMGAVLGYYAGRARFSRARGPAAAWLAFGFFVATALHGVFDYLLEIARGWHGLLGVGVFSAGLWLFVLHRVRLARAASMSLTRLPESEPESTRQPQQQEPATTLRT